MQIEKNNKLSNLTRILVALSGVMLIAAIFLPIWKIELEAPQYPEGLVMKIHADKLDGEIQIINGLNAYIGMRKLYEDDFIEFTVLPYIIGAIGLIAFVVSIVNRRRFFYIWGAIYVLFGILAMVDFYWWEYTYGHNLDPMAPIQVPGMAYSPPLIGSKQLLNFTAHSWPDIGGYLMITVGAMVAILGFLENRKAKKHVAKIS